MPHSIPQRNPSVRTLGLDLATTPTMLGALTRRLSLASHARAARWHAYIDPCQSFLLLFLLEHRAAAGSASTSVALASCHPRPKKM